MNKESAKPKDEWQQFAEDVAVCACNVVRALVPDTEARSNLKRQVLKTEARLLRGLLALVEGQLAQAPPSDASRPAPEKIPIR